MVAMAAAGGAAGGQEVVQAGPGATAAAEE